MGYAVRFEEVSKRYPRGGPRYPSLRHELAESAWRLGQRLRGQRPEPRGILALDRVSFEVEEGEAFAIIGPNGAGKSTALKLVARISYPTEGLVRVRGRVAALILASSLYFVTEAHSASTDLMLGFFFPGAEMTVTGGDDRPSAGFEAPAAPAGAPATA